MNLSKFLFFVVLLSFSPLTFSNEPTPTTLKFTKEEGGYVTGREFSTEDFKGKITAIFYVDPDHRTINDDSNQRLQAEYFNLNFYHSFAIINMAATWLPNAILNSALKSSQKEFPTTSYVKDLKKSFVSKWKLVDDGYQTIILNEKGEILFNHIGRLDQTKTTELISLIKKEISRLEKNKI